MAAINDYDSQKKHQQSNKKGHKLRRKGRLQHIAHFEPKGLKKDSVKKIGGASRQGESFEDKSGLDTSFMDGIWQECVDAGYANESLTSDLWQGMADGTLEPGHFGGFNVQDVAYCTSSANGWVKASVHAQNDGAHDLAAYLISKTVSNLENADWMRHEWGVQPSGVIIDDATKLYMKVENYVIEKLGPYYCPVANYACYQLWPWLAKELQSVLKPKNTPNVYYDFVNGNLEFQSYADKLANQIGIYAKEGKIKKDKALEIVANCLYCEAFMARSSTDQEMTIPFPYPNAKSP